MDAEYLKNNILGALSEAVASMAIKMPEDEVEFIGKYLLKYVERKEQQNKRLKEAEAVEESLKDYILNEEVQKKKLLDKALQVTAAEAKFTHFINSLNSQNSKSSAMDAVVDFVGTSLDIPAAYIAVKQVAAETETLYYLAASSTQQHVKGKKLVKVAAEEGEDAPIRQGISFDAFKLPEVPEEEAAPEEAEEGAEPKPPKPAPKMSPLVVENTMREKRCKFFGIPKLGAYVALPFGYQSLDHENGCAFNPGDAENGVPPSYQLAKVESQFIIGIDTIGKYRLIKPDEISRINFVGEELIKVFERCEEKIGREHLEFVNSGSLEAMASAVAAATAKIPDEEVRVTTEAADALAKAAAEAAEAAAAAAAAIAAAAAAAAEAAIARGEEPDPAPEPVEAGEPSPAAELLKPFKEAEAVVTLVWNVALDPEGDVANSFRALNGYAIPLPKTALYLIFALTSLLNIDPSLLRDVCGELNWDAIKLNVLPTLPNALSSYLPAAPFVLVSKECALASIKAFAEASNLFDSSIYPANIPIFPMLMQWLQKAIAAREAAIAYHTELSPKVFLEL